MVAVDEGRWRQRTPPRRSRSPWLPPSSRRCGSGSGHCRPRAAPRRASPPRFLLLVAAIGGHDDGRVVPFPAPPALHLPAAAALPLAEVCPLVATARGRCPSRRRHHRRWQSLPPLLTQRVGPPSHVVAAASTRHPQARPPARKGGLINREEQKGGEGTSAVWLAEYLRARQCPSYRRLGGPASARTNTRVPQRHCAYASQHPGRRRKPPAAHLASQGVLVSCGVSAPVIPSPRRSAIHPTSRRLDLERSFRAPKSRLDSLYGLRALQHLGRSPPPPIPLQFREGDV